MEKHFNKPYSIDMEVDFIKDMKKIYGGDYMNRFQLENIYKANGLTDFKLKDTEDLLKVHGINYRVEGYNRLDDLNRKLYEKFIVNIFNAFGLESRATLTPKGIYYVEEIDYLAKENPTDDYYIGVGGIVNVIDRNGMKSVHRTWNSENYKHLEVIEKPAKQYLRFEYEHGVYDDGEPRKEWLHVIKEDEWY